MIALLIGGLIFGAIAGVGYLNDATAHRQRSRAALKSARERGKEAKRQAQEDADKDTLKALTIRLDAFWNATAARTRSFSLATALITGSVIGSAVSFSAAGGVYWILSRILIWLHKRQMSLLPARVQSIVYIIRFTDLLTWQRLGLLHGPIKMITPPANSDKFC
jgi:hypothetical protein